MARKQRYVCTVHKGDMPRELLVAKKVMFVEMGSGGRNLRSRVVDWVCPDCLIKDPDWNKEKFEAPGHTPLAELLPRPGVHLT